MATTGLPLTVASLDVGVATLLSSELHVIHFPRLLLPPDAKPGAVVTVAVRRAYDEEQRRRAEFVRFQDELLEEFGTLPELGAVNVVARTQHTITLSWDAPVLHGATLKAIHVYRDRHRVRTLPPDARRVRLSGLAAATTYELTVVFNTSAARLTSDVLRVTTHAPDDFSGLRVAFSLFSVPEMNELKAIVAQLGGQWTDEFTPDNTHLICKAPAGARYEQARLWSIPAVGPEWLRDCLTRGRLPTAQQHYAERQEISAYFH